MTYLRKKSSTIFSTFISPCLFICFFLCLFTRVKSLACCFEDVKHPDARINLAKATACAEYSTSFEYLNTSIGHSVSAGPEILYCDVCTLEFFPWAQDGENPFRQACTSVKALGVVEFNRKYGGVGKCQYHPKSNKKESSFNCACNNDNECNKFIKEKFEVPEEVWDAKAGGVQPASACAKPYSTRQYILEKNTATKPLLKDAACKDRGDYTLNKCVAKYKLKFGGDSGVLTVDCALSDNKKDIDKWSIKFPKRTWEYHDKIKVAPTVAATKPTTAATEPPSIKPPTEQPVKPGKVTSGAPNALTTISLQVTICVVTWLIV